MSRSESWDVLLPVPREQASGDSDEEVAHLKARSVPFAGSLSLLEFQDLPRGHVAAAAPLFQIVRDKLEQSVLSHPTQGDTKLAHRLAGSGVTPVV